MTQLILVRHGETEANVSRVWHGALDAPLTERGRWQVSATASRIAQLQEWYPVKAFYVSPQPRAQSTAAAIAAAIGCLPTVEPDLREFDLGDWEGRSFQDLHDVENLWGKWRIDPQFAPPNGESPHLFNLRAVGAVGALAHAHQNQTVLIVTHGGVICNVLASWLGAGPADWRNWEPHNCAITVLEKENDRWQGRLVNDISHLPAESSAEDAPIWAAG